MAPSSSRGCHPRPSKRSKTSESNPRSTTGSSDAHAPINLNEDDDKEEEDEDVEANEPIRPIGRNRGKRLASASTGTGSKEESITSLLDELASINSKMTNFSRIVKNNWKYKKRIVLLKTTNFT